jgi:hypothetical protein
MATLTVQGYATRIFFEGKGVEVTEFYPGKDGEQKKRTFTAWFESAPDINVNAYGTFIGTVSAKVRFWVDKEGNPVINKATGEQGVSADISLNGSVFTPGREVDTFSKAAPATPAANFAAFGATPIINDETPF